MFLYYFILLAVKEWTGAHMNMIPVLFVLTWKILFAGIPVLLARDRKMIPVSV